MKKAKILVPALSVLALGMAASVTGTVAWFSANSVASVTGMSITTAVPTNLYIKAGQQGVASAIDDTSINTVVSGTNLQPSHLTFSTPTLTISTPSGYEEGQAPTPSSAGTPSGYTSQGTLGGSKDTSSTPNKAKITATGYASSYVAYQEHSLIKKTEESSKVYDLSATVNVTFASAPTAAAYLSLRCGFMVSVNTGTAWSWSAASSDVTGSGTSFTFGELTVKEDVVDNQIVNVAFVVWLDGDDADCVANNFLASDTMSVSISYAATQSAAA